MHDLFPMLHGKAGQLPLLDVCLRVGLAIVLGFIVAGGYYLSVGRRKDDSGTLPTTLVLLTVVIAIVTLVIGDSTARAFGLVGALSIVRFRTVVEDTRDTAFVIFAVVIGMAAGAGFAELALLGIPAVVLAALGMRAFSSNGSEQRPNGSVTVRIAIGTNPSALISETLAKFGDRIRLSETATAKQGASLELTYALRLNSLDAAFPLIAELNRLEGVQNVEWRCR
jgi:uncharacterized membrane protein YhiD involved in acid resistance